uniref:Uncharacterized protein n=1 Tax=Timema cristinae TaxID=61476 RepID=A0A7R9GSV6_TIMCR|nr:unnamed protein product [Timema cristinae]
MEGQDVCTRKAKPVKPLAITSIFNTLFPLDEIDSKRVIVGMSVKNNFTPYVQLEKCGGNCALFNRTEWQELSSYRLVISKLFSLLQDNVFVMAQNPIISLGSIVCLVITELRVLGSTPGKGSESPTFHGGQPTFSVPKVTLEDGATSPGHHELPNEISAPYEVPQFPIEQIEKKLAIQRHISSRVCRLNIPGLLLAVVNM